MADDIKQNKVQKDDNGEVTLSASKKTVWKKAGKIVMWVLLTPVILFVLLSIAIYIPPVQKAAVDWASEYLSEEMGMQVSVDYVRLKFPLDLRASGMTAVQDGDTILNAENLDVSIRMKPLLDKDVEVDDVCLYNVNVNTRNMVEACLLKGFVGELGFNSHKTSLDDERAVMSRIWVKDADLNVVLADSVPEDTTTSEPVTWMVDLEDVTANNVRLHLNTGKWEESKGRWIVDKGKDAMDVRAAVGEARVKGRLDLANEIYSIEKIMLAGSSLSYADMLSLTDVNAEIDSVVYKGTGDLSMAIRTVAAKEKSGLEIKDVKAHVVMDTLSLKVPDMLVKTSDSRVELKARMDMNAFDSINPGTFMSDIKAQIGKGDILTVTKVAERFMDKGTDLKDVRNMIVQYLPSKPVELILNAEGNMQNLEVSRLYANADRLLTVDGSASLTDGEQIKADAKAVVKSTRATVSADYNMTTEAYNANVRMSGFRSSEWIRMDEPVYVSGNITARGRGTDIYSPKTYADVTMDLSDARMGQIDLSSTQASVNLKDGNFNVGLTCDNDLLQTAFELAGVVKRKGVDANLSIDLPHCDIHGMGLYDDELTVSTQGQVVLTSDLEKLFMCEAHVDGLDLKIGSDSVHTQDFDLVAETTADSTYAHVSTGDLKVDFDTPNNALKLSDIFARLTDRVERQIKDRNIDIDELKAYFPEACIKASIGKNNPLSTVLKTYGVSFGELMADVDMGPEVGVTGEGHLYALRYDSVCIDTTFFDIYQDAQRLVYNAGVICSDQDMFDAFSAYLDGYLSAGDAEAHLTFFNKMKEKGIDLGVHAQGSHDVVNSDDVMLHLTLFPQQPIIAYRPFELNTDNYIDFCKDGHINGDVRLKSVYDDCLVALTAGLNTYQKQWANAVVENLNLKEIVKVVPFMPRMEGMMYADAMFNQNEHDDNFWVGGTAGVKQFVYEGLDIGDLETDFDYMPEGLTKHTVQGQVMYNDVDVAYLKGLYNSEGDGYVDASLTLEDIPMELFDPFIPDHIIGFTGKVAGVLSVKGTTDALMFNGDVAPTDVHVLSNMYSLNLGLANDTISIKNSKLTFDRFNVYGAGKTPLTINGYVDFADMENLNMSLSAYGKNFKLIEAKRSNKSVLYGDVYGDLFGRVTGTLKDLYVRGLVNVLSSTNVTYIMTDTPLAQGDRLDDIVTFVNFDNPKGGKGGDNSEVMGLDMNVTLSVEDGAKFNCEFSADRQSYIYVRGGGSLNMSYTPEGVLSVLGRLTVNDGEMKYTLPVIPLKTFTIASGSYVEFTGDIMNPILNVIASERTKAVVSSDGASRSVAFDVGMSLTNTLSNMGLAFTIDAPTDGAVRDELAAYSDEEKNKLAVALLATGMYVSDNNTSSLTANNALNTFLQSEINNIAGKALNSFVDVSLGIDQQTYANGATGTDYSFKFSKRFFNDRLSVVIGGRVSDNKDVNQGTGIGSFIDDVSLEWRLDNSATRYVRLFHGKDYENVIEGVLEKNGAGVVLRKKVDRWTDLFIFK